MDSVMQKRMETMFHDAGFDLSRGQVDRFRDFYRLLVEYNERFDLTRILRFEDIIDKHFIDSMYITKLCDLPGSFVDIGTGAGFPGIPLKILLPDCRVVLAEPRYKRVEFLGMVIERLGLENVEIYPHKVTDHSMFDVGGVITRALESIDDTLSRVHHFLPRGGKVIFMKGPGAGEDIRLLSEENRGEFRNVLDRDYTLPGTGYQRRAVVYEKLTDARQITYRIFKDESENREIVITSKDNRQFKELKKLTTPEGIKKQGRVMVAGTKLAGECVADFRGSLHGIILYDGCRVDNEDLNTVIAEMSGQGKVYIFKKGLYNELDVSATEGPLLIAPVPEMEEWDYTLGEGCNLLIPFQDPVNVGTVIRSAAGFGAGKIILLQGAANPFHPKSVRASGGAVFRVSLFRGPGIVDAGEQAQKRGLPLYTLDKRGTPIEASMFPERFLLLPGIEGPGLPDEMKEHAIAVPITDSIESLNAAIAASIAMFVSRRIP